MEDQVLKLLEDTSALERYTPANDTSLDIIINAFYALPVNQKAGLSLGLGFGLILCLCSTYCCIRWSHCQGHMQRCSVPCCPADTETPPANQADSEHRANQNIASSDADDTQTSFHQNSDDLSRRAFDLIAERVQSLRNSNIL